MGVSDTVIINCLLREGVIHKFDGAAVCEAMRAVPDHDVVCNALDDDLTSPPEAGYIVCEQDFESVSRYLNEDDLWRVFLLESERPPAILRHLEEHELPGVLTAEEWFRFRDLASHCYPFLRKQIAESLGFRPLSYFASENYAAYNPEMALPELLVRYLTAFDAWKRARS